MSKQFFNIPFPRYSPACWLVFPVCLLLAGSCPVKLAGQSAPHPAFRQYTTDDGLASSEVYHILQDKEGYIWISTDNGVSRFDGYEFRNYGVGDGLRENVIFLMQLDTLGRVWMQAMGGNLYFFEGDTIVAYRHNEVLRNFKDRLDSSKGFIVEGAGEKVHIADLKYGVITIDEAGKASMLLQDQSVCHVIFEKKGVVLSSIISPWPERNLKLHPGKESDPVVFFTPGEKWTFPGLPLSGKKGFGLNTFRIGKGKYLFLLYNDLFYIENGVVQWQRYYPFQILHIDVMEGEKLLVGLHHYQGLKVYDSVEALHKEEGLSWLSGQSVSFFMEDADGGQWFATNNNGVFYAPAGAMTVYDKEAGLPDDKVTALTIKNENELFVGMGNGEIWHLDTKQTKWSKLPIPPNNGEIRDLYYDPIRKQLWAGIRNLYVLKNNKWIEIKMHTDKRVLSMGNRLTASPGGRQLWTNNHFGIMQTDLESGKAEGVFAGYDHRTYSVQEDFKGRIWVGRPGGLFEWKDNVMISQGHIHPAFSLRVEDLALLPDSTLVVATKGGGVVFWNDDKTEQITMANGLTADMLECVHAGADDIVWVGTLNGLNRMTGSWGERHVEKITSAHGLPSDEINQIATLQEAVWIATNKGLVRFSPKKGNKLSPSPIISSMLANKKSVEFSKKVSLAASENNLTLEYFAINYKMNGRILYRYRLDGAHWTTTRNRSLNFPSLPFGGHQFEVQAQNEDGLWSESTHLDFEILPPWWATLWARLTGVAFCGVAVFGFYKFRTSRLKEAHRIQLQITELERSALQAQMNPHFIFNCLNSIQNFILQNEKDAAIQYLGRFASLVRSMLNASVVGKVTLDEEVRLLTSYLELEKLRFNDRFTFQVKTAAGLDTFEIKIPPLLIQPYVENAVIHGVSGHQEGGSVEVFFEGDKSNITVSIKDNGKGILPKHTEKDYAKPHKSFGMSITKSRLELLSAAKGEEAVSTKTIRGENGQIEGTEIIIKIKT